MWVEDDKKTGYCFSSNHDEQVHGSKYYTEKALSEIPESDTPYVEKEPQDISWVQELRTLDNNERGLKAGAYRHFGVKHGVSRQDGRTVTETYYPMLDDTNEVTGYKVRVHNPKNFYALGSVRNALPFGWLQALEIGGYTLYITEGEEDAVATFTAWMREKKQKVAVISLKQGNESVIKTLQPILKHIIDKWKQVVFLPDMDDAGSSATKDIRALFPSDYAVKIAKYTEKDSNEMVKQGKEKELVSSCYNAGVPLSSGIKEFTSSDFDIVKKEPEFGLSFPYKGLTDLLRGIRLGTTIYVGAPEKAGKCLEVYTPVRMADGSVKQAGKVEVGDKLMGVDGFVTVQDNFIAIGDLVEIKQNKGMDFWVTPNHTLCYYSEGGYKEREVKDIAPYDWEKGQQFHVSVPRFLNQKPVWNPYLFGVWLGDGHVGNGRCTLNKDDAPTILRGEEHHPVKDYEYASGSINVTLKGIVEHNRECLKQKMIDRKRVA